IFVDWLKIVVTKARIIFVSSHITQDQILRWAVMVGVSVTARIVPVEFGRTELGSFLSAPELKDNHKTSLVHLPSFVLCVGTVDRRKNQSLLCKIWTHLISNLGEDHVPQLVLAGRNDLGINDLNANSTTSVARSQIIILEHLSDQELAGLYRA